MSQDNNQNNNDLREFNLKGKVKSVRETPYKAKGKFGAVVKDGIDIDDYISLSIYNEQGNIVELSSLKSGDGSLLDKNTYKYDSEGNLVEENSYDSNGSLTEKTTYKYDSEGYLIEQVCYCSEEISCYKVTYKYDSEDYQVEENTYNADGSLFWKWIHQYDSEGNLIEENRYDDNGSLDIKTTYKYDSEGNLVESYSYSDSLNNKWTYKYDSEGNEIEKIHSNVEDSSVDVFMYKYDSDGNQVEENVNYDYGSLKIELKFEYIYDNHGNWITKIAYDKDEDSEEFKPQSITERTIEYYE